MSIFGARGIPTAVHGWVDYSVAALLAAGATSTAVSPRVRRTLAAAGAYHAAYSLVTDYELGLRPWVSMRQHVLLDALGAVALVGAGMSMRGASARERRLLMVVGVAELAMVAMSDHRPMRGSALPTPVDVGYKPLDTLKRVADDVYVVDSTLPGLMGKALPVRMTVIRLSNGGLLLHSPAKLTEALRAELNQIGPVSHLVAPNVAHWLMVQQWQTAYPAAAVWAAPGLSQRRQVRRSGLRIDHELGPTPPETWNGDIELTMIPGGLGFNEVALFHTQSRTLLLTDLVLNLEPHKLAAPVRFVARLFGSLAPDGMPPPYLRMVIKMRRREAAQAVSRLIAAGPDRVIFAHGRWFDTNAVQRLRVSTRWL